MNNNLFFPLFFIPDKQKNMMKLTLMTESLNSNNRTLNIILIITWLFALGALCLEPSECHMRVPKDLSSQYKLICTEDKCIAIEQDVISFDGTVNKELSINIIEDYLVIVKN